MRGKVFKRITASLMALTMFGASLPADIGGLQLFSGSVMTASAADSFTYAVYSWNTETNRLESTDKTVYASGYTELTRSYLEGENYILEGSDGIVPKVFVVKEDLTVEPRITIKKGTRVDIVVPEGVTFKCVRGIRCACDKDGKYATLRILGEGKVITTSLAKYASIGGDNKEVNGVVEFHGPEIDATGGGYSAAIGGGEESTLYQGGEGGKVYISGGKMEITLRNSNSDDRRGNEAIGAGANDSKSGFVYIHNNNNEGDGNSFMRVSYNENDKWIAVKAGDRSGKLHSHKNMKVEPCDHTDGNGKSGWSYTVDKDDNTHKKTCKYCDKQVTESHSGNPCACGDTSTICKVMLKTDAGVEDVPVCAGEYFTLPYSKGDIITSVSMPSNSYSRLIG